MFTTSSLSSFFRVTGFVGFLVFCLGSVAEQGLGKALATSDLDAHQARLERLAAACCLGTGASPKGSSLQKEVMGERERSFNGYVTGI